MIYLKSVFSKMNYFKTVVQSANNPTINNLLKLVSGKLMSGILSNINGLRKWSLDFNGLPGKGSGDYFSMSDSGLETTTDSNANATSRITRWHYAIRHIGNSHSIIQHCGFLSWRPITLYFSRSKCRPDNW